MKLKRHNRRFSKLGLATGTVAGLLSSSMMLTPMTIVSAAADPQQTQINVTLEPTIALSLESEEIAIELDPTAGTGGFGTGSTKVLASTNSSNGYTLYVESSTDETAMRHKVETVTTQFAALTAATDEDNFPVNSWGYYSLVNENYAGVPVSGSRTAIVNQTDSPAWYDEDDESQAEDIEAAKFDFTVAAKANSDLVSGNYSATVVLTAVTNS